MRYLALLTLLFLAAALLGQDAQRLHRLSTSSGKVADPDSFFEASDCGECHATQHREWTGSLHSRAHTDPLYRAFAELARKEAGEAVYRFCSSCHAPLATVTGEVGRKGKTFLTHEGVTCDGCHTAREVKTLHAGGGGNASLVLDEGEARYGPLEDAAETPAHPSKHSALHKQAKFCSACHTLIHAGVVIENTFAEWKASPYAKAGIQCQDCHMRTVEQALEVARTMKPVKVAGKAANDSPVRPNVYQHLFVGANVNVEATTTSTQHAAMAEQRLKNAAAIALKLPERVGKSLAIEVAVTNKSAGHAIPTSITELRQVWIDLSVVDATGKEIYRSGAIGADGAVDNKAVMFHSVLLDKSGKVTFRPWLAAKMAVEKLIPPKATVKESYTVDLPEGVKGPLKVRAVLRYRSAPQEVLDRLFGKGKFAIRVVDMCSAEGQVPAAR